MLYVRFLKLETRNKEDMPIKIEYLVPFDRTINLEKTATHIGNLLIDNKEFRRVIIKSIEIRQKGYEKRNN